MIDLHAHTNNSDGTNTVPELIALAQETGLKTVAITDHDTNVGWSQLPVERDIQVVRGMEISTKYQGHGVHLLAYLFNPETPAMEAIINSSTENRIRQFVTNLSADYEITYEEVLATAGSVNINRPHIALVLISKGYISSIQEGFDSMLGDHGGYYVEKTAPSLVQTIDDVRAAGGIPVVAHFLSDMRPRERYLADLEPLLDAGLLGVEVDHREHLPSTRDQLREFANKHNLIITGSSDFHGANKPNRLGENTTNGEMLARIIEIGHLPLI